MVHKSAPPKKPLPAAQEDIPSHHLTTDHSGRVVDENRMLDDLLMGDHREAHPAQAKISKSEISVFEEILKMSQVAPKPTGVPCKICNRLIRGSMPYHILTRHSREAHKSKITIQAPSPQNHPSFAQRTMKLQESYPQVNTNRMLVHCPVCDVTVRTDRLARHMAKMHSDKINDLPKSNDSIPTPSEVLKRLEQQTQKK